MNTVAYCRVSTDKDDQLNSLETQKEFFELFTQKNKYNLVDIYADEGKSGTRMKNRSNLLRLLSDAEKRKFELVLIKDVSRLARNTVDFLTSVRLLKSLGVKVVFVNYDQTSSDSSEFTLTLLSAMAQEESHNTSKRVKFGKKLTAEKGRVPNITYGYDKIKGDSYNLNKNPTEVEVIHRIYKMYIEDGHGASKIALILNQERIKTKRGCNWSQNAICRILTNPIYVGRLINCKEEVQDFLTGVRVERDERDWFVHDRPQFRIIDDETFAKAAEILEGRNVAFNTTKTRQSNRHLFSTLIKCAECGYSYRRRVRTYVNTYTDWMCSVLYSKTTGKGQCDNKITVDEGELIQEVENFFKGWLEDMPNIKKKLRADFDHKYKSQNENIKTEKELKDKLAKLNRSRDKCMEMYEDEQINREEMNEKMSNFKNQIERLNIDLMQVQVNLNKGEALENVIEETFKDIESIVSVKDMTNTQLKKIIDKIVVSPDGHIDIHLKLLTEIGVDETLLHCDIKTPRYNDKARKNKPGIA